MNETIERTEMHTECVLAVGKTFVWHQLFVANAKPALEFYTKALDWGQTEMPVGDSAYSMLTSNGYPVAGVVGLENCPEASGTPPHWSVSIGVDDVDERAEKCVALGAQVLFGPMDIPEVGRTILLKDPFGAAFWLFKGNS